MKIFVKAILFLFTICSISCATSKLGNSGQAKIKAKTFVILGASSGFGRGVAEELGRYGANVVLASRRTELLEEIATKIRTSGGTAHVVTTDISKPADVERLATAAIERFGAIDVWINMAGVGVIGRFWEIPVKDQTAIVDINLKGFIYGSHEALRIFLKQQYGTLINMGSIESENPLAYHAAYAATKAGVRHLGQAINQELRLAGQKRIKVVTVQPWAVDTPFWTHAANYSGRKPRMAAMDSADKVVNAVLRMALRPRKELAVGWKAKGSKFFHKILPHSAERFSANVIHRYQIENPPPTKDTTGSVFKPMEAGREVDGGVREQMKKERKQRRNKQ